MKQNIHSRIFKYGILAISFFIPLFPRLLPWLITFVFLNSIAEGNFRAKIYLLKLNKISLLLISFYVLFLVGMLWTENKNAGWFDLQVKLSVLIFPLIFSSPLFNQNFSVKKNLVTFVKGCLASSLLCFSIAFYKKMTTGQEYFTYMDFSPFFHPSYLAMYLNYGFVIVLIFLYNKQSVFFKLNNVICFFTLMLFALTILFLASKTGIIILMFSVLTYIIILIFIKQKVFPALIFLFFLTVIFVFAMKKFPYISERIESSWYVFSHLEEIDKNDSESNVARILIWKAGLQVAKENFFLGAGTGDVKDVLMKRYKDKGITGAYENRLNAHNQFLQTFIALGVIGFLFLALIFILPFSFALKHKKYYYLIFLLITTLNFFVESMLETQAGVIFYAFFNSLLLKNNNS